MGMRPTDGIVPGLGRRILSPSGPTPFALRQRSLGGFRVRVDA
jgi:hypothetical protein